MNKIILYLQLNTQLKINNIILITTEVNIAGDDFWQIEAVC